MRSFNLSPQQLERLNVAIDGQKKPEILLFRILGPQLQTMFTELLHLKKVPRLLLHGNPHLDNYARTHNGTGLIDFDRSRIGPSLWDITRALTSIAFWSEGDRIRPNEEVARCFFSAYEQSIVDRLIYWDPPDFLRQIRPKKFQLTPQYYIESGKKWSKKLQANLVDPSDEFYLNLYQAYLEKQPEGSLDHWTLSEIAEVAGSMGKRHYVYLLTSELETREPILLDIKETYSEEDNKYFHNPFDHQGERMVTASRLYSPGLEERIGFCSFDQEEYWVRQIPTFSVKVPVGLTHDQSIQLASSIGNQLGRAHRIVDEIYTDGNQKNRLIKVAQKYFERILDVSEEMNQAVIQCFRDYQTS